MRGGANMGGCSSSHLGIFDISTNMALGSDRHRGELCSLNEPNSLEKMREKRRNLFSLAFFDLKKIGDSFFDDAKH